MPDDTPFQEFILESAGKYLQTVVLVDDSIFAANIESVKSGLKKPPSADRTLSRTSAEQGDEKDNVSKQEAADVEITAKDAEAILTVAAEEQQTEEQEAAQEKEREQEKGQKDVSFQAVQNSFAGKRIICSLYQPEEDATFNENSDVYQLCAAADVVIVDWALHGDIGNRATELVGNLIQHSTDQIPHQLRLILIYTLRTDLENVTEQIIQHLKEQGISINKQADTVLQTDNARLVVLGKTEKANPSESYVSEDKLAERIIKEFAKLASGLLQGIILRGLAYIRENNHRIVMRFHNRLDSAFLAHRALLLPDEAFDQIIPLLTDELRAVLEDTMGERPLGEHPEEIITDWCMTNWVPPADSKGFSRDGCDIRNFAKDVFCKGPFIKNIYPYIGKNEKLSKLVKSIEETDGNFAWGNDHLSIELAEFLVEEGHLHQQLGALMCQRVTYRNAPRALHLGVILRELGRQRRYLICLQPVCDSVRIKGKKCGFIFCYLNAPADGKRITHTVLDLKNNLVQLQYKPKADNCFVAHFTSDADQVFAIKNQKGSFIFRDDAKKQYEWIAELKPEFSQRAAEEFGRTLSRVGLTESEWLRLKAK
ncbi:MAG: response regulator receiver domain [Desulfomonilaceae bacterium]